KMSATTIARTGRRINFWIMGLRGSGRRTASRTQGGGGRGRARALDAVIRVRVLGGAAALRRGGRPRVRPNARRSGRPTRGPRAISAPLERAHRHADRGPQAPTGGARALGSPQTTEGSARRASGA